MAAVTCLCGMALSYVCDGNLGTPWSDVILIRYHYIVIYTLVAILIDDCVVKTRKSEY